MSLRPLYIDLLSLVTRSRGGLQLLVEMRSDLLVSTAIFRLLAMVNRKA